MYLLTLNDAEEINTVRAQINTAPPGGFDVSGIRAALAVDEVLAKAQPGVPLEIDDKAYGYLQQRMRTARWTVASAQIVDLVERCESAPRKEDPKAAGADA